MLGEFAKKNWTFPKLVRNSGLVALTFLVLLTVRDLGRSGADASFLEVVGPIAGVLFLLWLGATALFWIVTRLIRVFAAKQG